MPTRIRSVLCLGLVAALLVSCGAPPPPTPPDEPDFVGSYYDLPGVTDPIVPLGGAVWIGVPVLVAEAAEGLSLVEPAPGWFLGPTFPVGEDGVLEIEFPEPGADLEALLVPAEQVFDGIDPLVCEVTVSDPSVWVTPSFFELISVPGLLTLTVDGAFPTLMTAAKLTATDLPHLATHTYFGFVYASGAVEVSALGTACEDDGLTADLSLQEGWNVISWTVHLDDMNGFHHLHAIDSPMPEVVYLAIPN
jgi:hypothetical protein